MMAKDDKISKDIFRQWKIVWGIVAFIVIAIAVFYIFRFMLDFSGIEITVSAESFHIGCDYGLWARLAFMLFVCGVVSTIVSAFIWHVRGWILHQNGFW